MAPESLRKAGVVPFRWATALLKCCVPVRDAEMIAGDLLEEFREEARGQWWYLRQVASFVPCRDTRLALRVFAMWFATFCVAVLFGLTREVLTPAYGVAVFLFGVPLSGFYLARKTDWFGLAFATSVVLTLAMVGVCMLAVRPPGSFWFPIVLGGVFAFLGALAGKMSLPSYETTVADALRAARLRTLRRSPY